MTYPLIKILFLIIISYQVTECNLESEIVKYLGGDIKFAIDHYGIDMMELAATGGRNPRTGTAYVPATAIGAWSATVATGAEWLKIQGPLYSNVYRKAA